MWHSRVWIWQTILWLEFWGFRGGDVSGRGPLGPCSFQLPGEVKMEAARTSETLGNLSQHYTASQPRRPQPGFKMLYVALCTQQLSVTVKISTLVREVLVLIIHQVNGYFNRRLRHSPQAFQTNAGLIPWKTPQPPPSRSIRSNNSWALSHSTLYNLPQLKQLN